MKKNANSQSKQEVDLCNNLLRVSAIYSHNQAEYRAISRKKA